LHLALILIREFSIENQRNNHFYLAYLFKLSFCHRPIDVAHLCRIIATYFPNKISIIVLFSIPNIYYYKTCFLQKTPTNNLELFDLNEGTKNRELCY